MNSAGETRSCFGFTVESELTLNYLREGPGDRLSVTVGDTDNLVADGTVVLEWRVEGHDDFHAHLLQEGLRFRLATSDSGSFLVEPGARRITVPHGGNEVKREERLWGVPAALCMLARGDHALHAAAIDVGGEAVVLAAPGTFGKTTLAVGFVRAGLRLLTEDLCCIRLDAGAAVIPGPAMLRIRPDVAESLHVPGARVLDAGDTRVHLALDRRDRGDCTPVPLRAVVFLRGQNGAPVLERMGAGEAIRDLFALGFRIRGAEDGERCFRATADVAASVPAWNLFYTRRLEELASVVEKVTRCV